MSVCGADGDRTRDLMHAMHALSQLSYSPNFVDGLYPVSGGMSRSFLDSVC